MTFVNTVNAYDKKEEAMEEMKQLASFAKHHVPEDHEKDSPQHAAVRAHKLLKNGGCAALVSLTLSESALLTDSIKELIARSVLAMSHRSEDRGLLIQQGTPPAQISRIVQTQAILFLKSMSKRGGSDMQRI